VKGKAVEDSQDARQEVLLPAYRVTGKPEVDPFMRDSQRYASFLFRLSSCVLVQNSDQRK
jgi:hypothetical protein